MTEPDGELLRQLGTARLRIADGDEQELMRLAAHPLELSAFLRRRQNDLTTGVRTIRLPLVVSSSNDVSRLNRGSGRDYGGVEAQQGPSSAPEVFVPSDADIEHAVTYGRRQRSGGPSPFGSACQGVAIAAAAAALLVVVILW